VNLTYRLAQWGLALDYTANLTGPMHLPAYSEAVARAYESATGSPLLDVSPAFSVHNLQVRKEMHLRPDHEVEVFAGLRNVFDYRQTSPLVGYYEGNPGFGESFDTAYVYGPIRGRSLAFGFRYMLGR
jgi:outer membrane receptor for ferrienterochelin and colicins